MAERKYSILLVDDDADMCESLADVITLETDHEVKYSTDPMKALKMMEKDSFDAAVIDYRMPGMNGLELLREMKKKDPALTVFLLTAFLSEQLIEDARRAGIEKVLSKFIWPDEVINAIQDALEKP